MAKVYKVMWKLQEISLKALDCKCLCVCTQTHTSTLHRIMDIKITQKHRNINMNRQI